MTSHRPEAIPASVRVTMVRDEPDEELPPLLYYATCVARGSDPTVWAKERGSDYWLGMAAYPELSRGSVPVPEPVIVYDGQVSDQSVTEVEVAPERTLTDTLTRIRQRAEQLNIPAPLAEIIWPPTTYVGDSHLDSKFDFKMIQETRGRETWEPHSGANTPIPYKNSPGPREAPTPIQSPPKAPTPVIPVIQPGVDSPTQIIPLIPVPEVPELFGGGDTATQRNIEPPDLELTRVWHRHPLGGST